MLELLIQFVFFQTINVTETVPCFLNETAGIDIFKNCGGDKDFINMAVMPFEWITGGYFSLLLVALLVLITYIKYHKAIYPILMGSLYLPISYFIFPDQFLSFAVIMAGLVFGIAAYHIVTKQTKEYSG